MKKKYPIQVLLPFLLFCAFSWSQKTEIDSLKRVLRVAKVDTTKVNLYNHIANQFKESNPDSTAYYATKAATMSQKINYPFGLATSYLNRGNSNIILSNYQKAKIDFEKAKTSFSEQLEDNETKEIKNGLARSYASLGVVYSEENNYAVALENYQKALKIYLEIGQKNNISKAYNNIGIIYKSQGNYPKAIEYLKKALQIQEEIGEQAAAMSLTNIGVIYYEQNDSKKALEYYTKAEKLFEKIDNLRGFALLKNYLGDYYKKQNQMDRALASYTTSLNMYNTMQNKHGAALVLYNLGQLYFEQNKASDAINYANQSLSYAKEVGLLDQAFHSEKLLSDIYEAQGKHELSLFHYKEYTKARDSINTIENSKKYLKAEMDFEYQMKESLLLEKSKRQKLITLFSIIGGLLLLGLVFVIFNRRQVKRRLTLQKEVTEYEQKALHLQMNPHFVFNCLGSISSFIVQNGTDSALKYLSKFSKLMRLTLEYSKGSIIPIDKEIEGLQNYLELEQLRFHNSFSFSLVSSERVEFNMGLPPLLIQPFVENAILHGLVPKEGNGKIEVNFDVQNNQLVCTITDNGIGITKSKEMKENSMKAHQSMALEITKKRLEIMEATISKSAQIEIKEIEENNAIQGTKVTLRLPIQYIQ